MPMNKDRLGTAIHNAIEAQGIAAGSAITPTQREDMWKAIADQIIIEIQGFAVVTVPFVVGVTPGGGNSGAGSGTVA